MLYFKMCWLLVLKYNLKFQCNACSGDNLKFRRNACSGDNLNFERNACSGDNLNYNVMHAVVRNFNLKLSLFTSILPSFLQLQP